MLTQLSIQNIVLVRQCDIPFSRGLCVLTGETGAGKSILLDALGLALGMRGESRLVRSGEPQGSVCAEFDIAKNSDARKALESLGLPIAQEVIMRRSITADGKTRCFINDQAVSVNALRTLGDTLVEIHGQHDQRGLLDASLHRQLLDEYGGLATQVGQTGKAFSALAAARVSLQQLQADIARAQAEEDYLRHAFNELQTLSPEAGEEEKLAQQRTRMMQSEKIGETLQAVVSELGGNQPVASTLRVAQRMLSRSAQNKDNIFAQVIDALDKASVEVEEAQAALEKLQQELTHDPAQLESTEERLFALKAAARKYDTTVDGLAQVQQEFAGKLGNLDSQQEAVAMHQKALEEAEKNYVALARALSVERQRAARKMEIAVSKELAPLKMAGTRFRVAIESLPAENWGASGMDTVRFEAATNVGSLFAPLHKIASGGELSRFMLAMKVALKGVSATPTYIFDEIDTGTGGAVADAIGQRLAKLGREVQVLVVTHLPQVAACGDYHLRVHKEQKKGSTVTLVEVLNDKARKEELARMLAGAEITPEARRAAAKLLEAAG